MTRSWQCHVVSQRWKRWMLQYLSWVRINFVFWLNIITSNPGYIVSKFIIVSMLLRTRRNVFWGSSWTMPTTTLRSAYECMLIHVQCWLWNNSRASVAMANRSLFSGVHLASERCLSRDVIRSAVTVLNFLSENLQTISENYQSGKVFNLQTALSLQSSGARAVASSAPWKLRVILYFKISSKLMFQRSGFPLASIRFSAFFLCHMLDMAFSQSVFLVVAFSVPWISLILSYSILNALVFQLPQPFLVLCDSWRSLPSSHLHRACECLVYWNNLRILVDFLDFALRVGYKGYASKKHSEFSHAFSLRVFLCWTESIWISTATYVFALKVRILRIRK